MKSKTKNLTSKKKILPNKNQKITFRLSSPELKNNEDKIKISEIDVLLEKEPMTFRKIIDKLRNE